MSDPSAAERRERLLALLHRARGCERCPQLVAERTTVVFGSGDADADLMFVGEAPGASEDRQGVPFVGASGKLLAGLLEELGLRREDVFIANVLKCRPPGNRDPLAWEIENCRGYLEEQVALVRPTVVATLGNFATKLLRGDPEGITRVHGRVQDAVVGRRRVRLLPLHHPAAALYQRSNLDLLRADLARVPALLAAGPPEQPDPVDPATGEAVDDAAVGDGAEGAHGTAGDPRGAGDARDAGEAVEPAGGRPAGRGGPDDDQLALF